MLGNRGLSMWKMKLYQNKQTNAIYLPAILSRIIQLKIMLTMFSEKPNYNELWDKYNLKFELY